MTTAAIIVAAGRGNRFGGPTPKQFLPFGGKPLFLWSVLAFQKAGCAQVVLVVPAERRVSLEGYAQRYCLTLVPGGKERPDSVRAGLRALAPGIDLVAIHDAARPLVTPALIEKSFQTARRRGAAVVAVAARDTVKLSAHGGKVDATVPRTRVWLAQTPQTFRRTVIERAYASLGRAAVTDDAQAVERSGKTVAIVPGDYRNLKITDPDDLRIAKLFCRGRARRT